MTEKDELMGKIEAFIADSVLAGRTSHSLNRHKECGGLGSVLTFDNRDGFIDLTYDGINKKQLDRHCLSCKGVLFGSVWAKSHEITGNTQLTLRRAAEIIAE